MSAHRDTDVVSAKDCALAREKEGLRREVRVLKEERDNLKKATLTADNQVERAATIMVLAHLCLKGSG